MKKIFQPIFSAEKNFTICPKLISRLIDPKLEKMDE